jgi:hypothetical protein
MSVTVPTADDMLIVKGPLVSVLTNVGAGYVKPTTAGSGSGNGGKGNGAGAMGASALMIAGLGAVAALVVA